MAFIPPSWAQLYYFNLSLHIIYVFLSRQCARKFPPIKFLGSLKLHTQPFLYARKRLTLEARLSKPSIPNLTAVLEQHPDPKQGKAQSTLT